MIHKMDVMILKYCKTVYWDLVHIQNRLLLNGNVHVKYSTVYKPTAYWPMGFHFGDFILFSSIGNLYATHVSRNKTLELFGTLYNSGWYFRMTCKCRVSYHGTLVSTTLYIWTEWPLPTSGCTSSSRSWFASVILPQWRWSWESASVSMSTRNRVSPRSSRRESANL